MTQSVAFLPRNTRDGRTAEHGLARDLSILGSYTYAEIVASWHGTHDDSIGTFVVLDGPEHVIQATFDRLASGLYFAARIVGDLNR